MTDKPKYTIKDRIEQFMKLRAKMKEIEARHEEELAPYKNAKAEFETFFLQKLEEAGVDNMKSEAGTIFKAIDASCTVKDGDAFRTWIMENQAFQYADIRANKTTVRAMVDEGGSPPPGVEYVTRYKLNARAPSKS